MIFFLMKSEHLFISNWKTNSWLSKKTISMGDSFYEITNKKSWISMKLIKSMDSLTRHKNKTIMIMTMMTTTEIHGNNDDDKTNWTKSRSLPGWNKMYIFYCTAPKHTTFYYCFQSGKSTQTGHHEIRPAWMIMMTIMMLTWLINLKGYHFRFLCSCRWKRDRRCFFSL